MLNFLQSIFSNAKPSDGPDERLITAAIERVIDGTDPRFRAAGGYRKVLRLPVTRAVEHVIALVDRMPPPVEISTARFAADPRLRAFFVSVDHLRETVSFSEDLQKFLRNPPPLPEGTIHCLLTLDREERGVLGMALRGGTVSKDVAQIVVNFTHHRLVGMAPNADEMRWELKKRAFDHLIQTALAHLTATREESERLSRRRRLLGKKLAALHAADLGIDALMKPSGSPAAGPNDIDRELAGIEAELAALETDITTLDGQLASIAASLGEPEQHLRVEVTSLTLDPMGVRLEGDAAANVAPIQLAELVSGERRRVMLPGYVIRAELLPPRDFIAEAQRRLQGNR
jgi:hypothetical protein